MTIALKHVVIAGTLWGLVCTGIVWHVSRRLHPTRPGHAVFAGAAPESRAVSATGSTNLGTVLGSPRPALPPAQD